MPLEEKTAGLKAAATTALFAHSARADWRAIAVTEIRPSRRKLTISLVQQTASMGCGGGVDGVGGFEKGLDVGGDGFEAHEGFLDFRA